MLWHTTSPRTGRAPTAGAFFLLCRSRYPTRAPCVSPPPSRLPIKRYLWPSHSKHVRRDPNLDRAVLVARPCVFRNNRSMVTLRLARRQGDGALRRVLLTLSCLIPRSSRASASCSPPDSLPTHAPSPAQSPPSSMPAQNELLTTDAARHSLQVRAAVLSPTAYGPSPARGRQARW